MCKNVTCLHCTLKDDLVSIRHLISSLRTADLLNGGACFFHTSLLLLFLLSMAFPLWPPLTLSLFLALFSLLFLLLSQDESFSEIDLEGERRERRERGRGGKERRRTDVVGVEERDLWGIYARGRSSSSVEWLMVVVPERRRRRRRW